LIHAFVDNHYDPDGLSRTVTATVERKSNWLGILKIQEWKNSNVWIETEIFPQFVLENSGLLSSPPNLSECRIFGSCSSGFEVFYLLGCNTL
jgi:hypothetical protein